LAQESFERVNAIQKEIGINIDDRLTAGAAKAFGE
jgi:hypothetical protein